MPHISRITDSASRPLLLLLLLVAAAAVAFANGRLGGESDAGKVIEKAFSGQATLRSARVDADLKVSLSGVPSQLSSPVRLKLGGVFDQEKGRLPKLDLDMDMNAVGQSVQLGLVSTGKDLYVGYQGRHYVVPDRQLEQLAQRGRTNDQSNALLESLGVDPAAWVKNETEMGTTNVGGVEARHISADVDVARVLDDFTKLAASAPRPAGAEAPQIPSSAVDKARDAVKEAKLDVFVGKEDNVPRRVQLKLAFEAESPAGGSPAKGDMDFVLNISDVNKPVHVSAPKNARPFSELAPRLGTQSLGGDLSGAFGSGSGEPAPPAPPSRDGGAPTPPVRDGPGEGGAGPAEGAEADTHGSAAYLRCVEKAGSSAELQSCAPLLQ